MSLEVTVEGAPLAELGLNDLEIIGPDGRVIGPLEGVAVFSGETLRQALERSLPPGCDLRLKTPAEEPPK